MAFTRPGKWTLFVTVTCIGTVLDIGTKSLAVRSLTPGLAVPVTGDFLQFLLLFNTGGIFGIQPRAWIPGFPINIFFYVFSVIAMTLLVFYYHNLKCGSWPIHWGIALIMPGAIGNLSDRLLYPNRGVVDFIKIGISEEIYWPIFNFADMFITIGVSLVLLDMFREELRKRKAVTAGETG
jgi:signal peptidase II